MEQMFFPPYLRVNRSDDEKENTKQKRREREKEKKLRNQSFVLSILFSASLLLFALSPAIPTRKALSSAPDDRSSSSAKSPRSPSDTCAPALLLRSLLLLSPCFSPHPLPILRSAVVSHWGALTLAPGRAAAAPPLSRLSTFSAPYLRSLNPLRLQRHRKSFARGSSPSTPRTAATRASRQTPPPLPSDGAQVRTSGGKDTSVTVGVYFSRLGCWVNPVLFLASVQPGPQGEPGAVKAPRHAVLCRRRLHFNHRYRGRRIDGAATW